MSLVWYYTHSFKPVLSRETAFEAEYLQFINCDQRLSCRALKAALTAKYELVLCVTYSSIRLY